MVTKKNRIIIVLIMCAGVATYSLLSIIRTDKANADRDKLYSILDSSNYFSGKIIDFYSERGHVYITLNDSKRYLIEHSRNYNYKSYFLNSYLNVGDSLVKLQGSDTLYIYRAGKKSFFIIGEFIGEDPTPKLFGRKR